MSMNLIHTNDAATDNAAPNWAAIMAVAGEHGTVYISEAIVDAVAGLLEDAVLSNGELVQSYPSDGEEFSMASFVSSFGPGLLGENAYREVRTLLETDENGAAAVELLDTVVELGLQISLSGKEFPNAHAHIKAVNWPADDVDINRCSGNMYQMLRDLGIKVDTQAESGEVDFSTFVQAVNDNAERTDMGPRLKAFVACAQRNNATRVYWA